MRSRVERDRSEICRGVSIELRIRTESYADTGPVIPLP